MKEYIDAVIYEASGLTIGLNENRTSVIFGHKASNEWVVLGEPDFPKFIDSYKANKPRVDFDGFGYAIVEEGIVLNQQDNCVFLHRDILDSLGGKWSNSRNRRAS